MRVPFVSVVLVIVMAVTCLLSGCTEGKGEIAVISREDGSGTKGAFIELTGIEESDASGNKVDKTTPEATVVNSTSAVIAFVSGNRNAIGYVSFGSLNDTVKAIHVDGVAVTYDNIGNGTYKVFRPFTIATSQNPLDLTKDFILFMISEEGQTIVRDNGYIPITDSKAYDGTKPEGKIVVAGSSSVAPVMEKLKEAYLKINPFAQIEIQTSDSTAGMNSVMEGTCDIGMASREMKESEQEKLEGTVIAQDGIAIIVHKGKRISNLTMTQVSDIFSGITTSWEDVD